MRPAASWDLASLTAISPVSNARHVVRRSIASLQRTSRASFGHVESAARRMVCTRRIAPWGRVSSTV